MEQEQKGPILAVILCALILFGWQYFFAPHGAPELKNEKLQANALEVEHKTILENKNNLVEAEASIEKASNQNLTPVKIRLTGKKADESFIDMNTRFVFNNMKSSKEKRELKDVLGKSGFLQLVLKDAESLEEIIYDSYLESSASEYVFTSNNVKYSSDKIRVKINDSGVVHILGKFKHPIAVTLIIKSEHAEGENHQTREFTLFSNSVERFKVGDSEKIGEAEASWFGVDYLFHLFSLSWNKKEFVKYAVNRSGLMQVDFVKPTTEIDFNLLYSLKSYDLLKSMGNNLHQSIDFGIFGVIAIPILKVLQFFYGFVANYGIAIILLTFFLRTITFPLQYHSFKNMKKMQVITPELTKIKEKYKDDPKRMQMESMQLFKRTGANPWSGCLPLLLQLPIFIAFYKVLYNSVELMGAPFYGWIHDLGQKDPYYVLPLFVTAAMFLQQKMTPSATMDPAQQKVMLFMPLVFGFIMKDLPSGLSLYIFVSTLLGILQQKFVNRRLS